ncbi:hypothetical protein [Guggenheimella bovis]
MRERNVSLSGDYQRITKLNRNYIKNEIYFSEFLTPELLSETRLHLPNLQDFKLEDDRAIFISPVLLGKPLVDVTDLSSSAKVDIINKYLKIIKDFSDLPLFMQMNLVREENFYIVNGELMHRGVLIIEDVDFRYPLTYAHLIKAISKFALNLIDKDVNLFNFKNYFRNLQNNATSFKTIENIIDEVKDVYINDLFVEETLVPVEEVKVVNNHVKYMNFKLVTMVSMFLILLSTATFAMIHAVNLRDTQNLTALFRIESRDDNYLILDESYSPSDFTISEWKWDVFKDNALYQSGKTNKLNLTFREDGNYRIVLRVKDTAGNWSQPYEKTIQHRNTSTGNDDLDSFNFQRAVYDKDIVKFGTKSIRVDKSNSEIYLENIYLEDSVSVDFFSYSDHTEPILLKIEGYSAGKLVSERSQSITVSEKQWKKNELTFTTDSIDKLVIKVLDFDGNVWFDQFNIRSHK